jgi:hypothetical protein
VPTITIPIEDLVFVIATLVGAGLLLVTVLIDDILGGILDSFNIGFDIGGVSLMPPLLAFIAMFGVAALRDPGLRYSRRPAALSGRLRRCRVRRGAWISGPPQGGGASLASISSATRLR